MSISKKRISISSPQIVLPFFCEGCPYKLNGRCKGATNRKVYEEIHEAFVGCSAENRMMFLYDLYKRFIPIAKSGHEKLSLPRFIPQCFERARNPIIPLGKKLVAVSLTTLLYPSGRLEFKTKLQMNRAMGLPLDTKIALIGTCSDEILEKFWSISDYEHLWEEIANFGFEFVTSLTFSVYENWPLFSHKFNQDRNFLSYDIFCNMGIPCIPFLMPVDTEDYEYIGKWLTKRTDINIVAIYGSGFTRSDELFNELLERIRRIQSIAPRPLKFVITGVAKPEQMQTILREFDSIMLNPRPVMEALKDGNCFSKDLQILQAPNVKIDELILDNVTNFESFCNSIIRNVN